MTQHHYLLASLDPDMPMAVMIIPDRHHDDPFTVNAEEWADFGEALNAAKEHLSRYKPDGFTLGWNVNKIAGQTVGHAHCHVIARHADEPSAGQGIRSFLKHGWSHPGWFHDT